MSEPATEPSPALTVRDRRITAAVTFALAAAFFAAAPFATGDPWRPLMHDGDSSATLVLGAVVMLGLLSAASVVYALGRTERFYLVLVAPTTAFLLADASFVITMRRLLRFFVGSDAASRPRLLGRAAFESLAPRELALLGAASIALATGLSLAGLGRVLRARRALDRGSVHGELSSADSRLGTIEGFAGYAFGFALVAATAASACAVEREALAAWIGVEPSETIALLTARAHDVTSAVRMREWTHRFAALGVVLFVVVNWRHVRIAPDRRPASIAVALFLTPLCTWPLAMSWLDRASLELAPRTIPTPTGIRLARFVENRDSVDRVGLRAALTRDAVVLADRSRHPLDPARLERALARIPRVPVPEGIVTEPVDDPNEPRAWLADDPRIEVLVDARATRAGLRALMVAAVRTDLAMICFVGDRRTDEERRELQRVRGVEFLDFGTRDTPSTTCLHLPRAIGGNPPPATLDSLALTGDRVTKHDVFVMARRPFALLEFDEMGELETLFRTIETSASSGFVFTPSR